ncbi:hypothetical protein FPV67DRAFT_1560387 [Lyophyllum atratum]|nr:hypothetical protein FPV67DRAFT_1560387 [Lyophyllum atratum]
MSNLPSPTLRSSQEDVWYLKQVVFKGRPLPIITQNFNGPCSFIAICNILIIRGNILIEPPTRTTVSYEFLSQLVAEYLLKHSPNVDISDALSIMPHTQKGLDLNPLFTSSTSFLAATQTAGGELKLFSQVGIDLVHGWLADPESPEAMAMREENAEDYDSAVGLIAEADHIAGGLLVPIDVGESDHVGSASGRREREWTEVEQRKIRNALTIRQFLEQTQSQLTYHGLFHLASTLPAGALVALFRSSHLSVLYKSEGPNGNQWETPPAAHDSALYTLVTDYVFLKEPSVVWERIEDVDGSAGLFVDSDFVRASPAGGDWAGRTAEDTARDIQRHEEEAARAAEGGSHLTDQELARHLQAEEEHYARQEHQRYLQQQEEHDRRNAGPEAERRQKELEMRREKERKKQAKAEGKKKDCIIM